jgi:hypothetical protein
VGSSSRSLTRAALIAASLAVLGIAAVGCGGSDSSGGGDARAQFNRAFDGLQRLDSGDLDLSLKMEVEGSGQDGSFELGLTGPFQSGKSGGADLHLTGDSSLPGAEGSFDVRLTVTGQNLYLSYGGQTYGLSAAQAKRLGQIQGSQPSTRFGFKEACRMQLRASGADASVCDRMHPSSWIGGFSDEGTETVNGVETNHLQADVQVRNLVSDLFELGKAVLSGQGLPLGAFDSDRIADEVDRYIDKAEVSAYPASSDGIPRKLGLEFSVDAGDSGSVDLSADATFDHVNEPQTIAAPPGPIQPIEGLAQKLPPPFGQLLDCLLNAKSQAQLQACGTGAGALAPTGSDSSLQ